MIIGLDPGTDKSALVVLDGSRVTYSLLDRNETVIRFLRSKGSTLDYPVLVIEKIESFGMAVGKETFETVYWSGRFAEAYGVANVNRIGRKSVKQHLCGSARATDANIRQAIYDLYGGKEAAVGKKKEPGPLYGITSHLMSALAVAITWRDTHKDSPDLDSVEL